MQSINLIAVVLAVAAAFFVGAEARSEDDLRFVGVRQVFTKIMITNTTRTVFVTCSRVRSINTPCSGKRKKRNLPISLPTLQDSKFDNTELSSTLDDTVNINSGSGDGKQQKLLFTLWDTTTQNRAITVTSLESRTTVSLSFHCQPNGQFDVSPPACTG